jgi:hypothetical protein
MRRIGGAAVQNVKERVGLCGPRSVVWAEAQNLFWRVILSNYIEIPTNDS